MDWQESFEDVVSSHVTIEKLAIIADSMRPSVGCLHANTEEQAAEMEEVASAAETLSGLAGEVQKVFHRFQLKQSDTN